MKNNKSGYPLEESEKKKYARKAIFPEGYNFEEEKRKNDPVKFFGENLYEVYRKEGKKTLNCLVNENGEYYLTDNGDEVVKVHMTTQHTSFGEVAWSVVYSSKDRMPKGVYLNDLCEVQKTTDGDEIKYISNTENTAFGKVTHCEIAGRKGRYRKVLIDEDKEIVRTTDGDEIKKIRRDGTIDTTFGKVTHCEIVGKKGGRRNVCVNERRQILRTPEGAEVTSIKKCDDRYNITLSSTNISDQQLEKIYDSNPIGGVQREVTTSIERQIPKESS